MSRPVVPTTGGRIHQEKFLKHDKPNQPKRHRPGKRVTGGGNTNTDAYPHDAIYPPVALKHAEDGKAKRS